MAPDTNIMVHPVEGRTLGRTMALVGVAFVLAAVAYWLTPDSLPELGRRTIGIFVLAALLWATEALPLYATSLCVIALQILLLASSGGLAPVGDLSYKEFLRPFSSGIIILFFGGFLLSRAVTKHHIDRAIASRFLAPLAHSPFLLIAGIAGITAFFSMWMSNTATAAMMLAIIAPILHGLPPGSRFRHAVVLAVPFGANIGGIGTPIGTPPNAVALANLREAGLQVGFLEWMMVAVPLVIVLLAVTTGLLYVAFRPRTSLMLEDIRSGGKITIRGWITLAILLGAVLLWLTSKWHGIAEAVVALLAAALLTAFRVLERKDVDSIDWNILILMWGGLALGNAMQLTGVTDWLVAFPVTGIGETGLALLLVGVTIGLSTFMSNTAAANLLVPTAMALSVSQPEYLVMLVAFASSFAMALPISTPPNAIAFATGVLPVKSMLRMGSAISLVAAIVLLFGYHAMFAFLFGS